MKNKDWCDLCDQFIDHSTDQCSGSCIKCYSGTPHLNGKHTIFDSRQISLDEMGEELGKSVAKQLLINEKYKRQGLTFMEIRKILGLAYNKASEMVNKAEMKNV
jgi:hypothetical protein